jgi:hypothetical protein
MAGVEERCTRALLHDPPALRDVSVGRRGERTARILLHEQDRQPAGMKLLQHL